MPACNLVAVALLLSCAAALLVPSAAQNGTDVTQPVTAGGQSTAATTGVQATTQKPHPTDHQTDHRETHDPGHHGNGAATDHPVDHNTGSDHNGDHGNGDHQDDHGVEHQCPPEGEEGVRYAVAKFDFDHVRFPLIVSVWILFVTYAKIGNVRPQRTLIDSFK